MRLCLPLRSNASGRLFAGVRRGNYRTDKADRILLCECGNRADEPIGLKVDNSGGNPHRRRGCEGVEVPCSAAAEQALPAEGGGQALPAAAGEAGGQLLTYPPTLGI